MNAAAATRSRQNAAAFGVLKIWVKGQINVGGTSLASVRIATRMKAEEEKKAIAEKQRKEEEKKQQEEAKQQKIEADRKAKEEKRKEQERIAEEKKAEEARKREEEKQKKQEEAKQAEASVMLCGRSWSLLPNILFSKYGGWLRLTRKCP